MVDFSQKLNYLFELAHAEGKELAAVMNLTPPQISKMRRGVRGLPKNRESAVLMAHFFAQRCSSDFQREELAKTIRVAQVRNLNDVNALAGLLLDWLSDEQNADEYAARRADSFLRQFGALYGAPIDAGVDENANHQLGSGRSSFFAYYGGEGKRLAVQTFLNYLLQLKQAYTINILTDENIAWVTDDPGYSRRLQSLMVRLTEQGCRFRRVAGPIMDMDQAFESLNRWFPLYMTGKATSYYYKRMRDNLNRITLFVVPDVAVLFSFSVSGLPNREAVTFFTVDTKTANSLAVEFESYLAMCEPIMKVYSTAESPKRLHACMLEYESCAGSCLQRSDALSFITLPWDIAMVLECSGRPADKSEFLTSFAQRYKKFNANLERYPFVDIIRLADIEQVMAGEAHIPVARVLGDQTQYYTPPGYLQHLRSVLYLLEHRKNYHVVLRRPEDQDSTLVYVKEGFCAILARDAAPMTVFEVSERYIVDAFGEYLRRLMPPEQGEPSYRRSVAAELRALIAQLESRLRDSGHRV